jgi:hypothetical protein
MLTEALVRALVKETSNSKIILKCV